jgi:SpoIIAA-like
MIERIDRDGGAVLGFRAVGDVTAADYEILTPAVQAAVEQYQSVRLLLDLTDFGWEKVEAWGADLRFGQQFRHAIERMAIVGDRRWERWLAHLAAPLYAQQAQFFTDVDEAWAWLG